MLAVLLPRTRLRSLGRLVAVVVPSLLIAMLGAQVQIVSDVGDIAGSVPTPHLPSFNVAGMVNVLTGALSVAIVALVQGVGVSQKRPNRDGSRTRISRDFIAQGAAKRGVRPVPGTAGRRVAQRHGHQRHLGGGHTLGVRLCRPLDGRHRCGCAQPGGVHRYACARCAPDSGREQAV